MRVLAECQYHVINTINYKYLDIYFTFDPEEKNLTYKTFYF